jgi:hypothetical protein
MKAGKMKFSNARRRTSMTGDDKFGTMPEQRTVRL